MKVEQLAEYRKTEEYNIIRIIEMIAISLSFPLNRFKCILMLWGVQGVP